MNWYSHIWSFFLLLYFDITQILGFNYGYYQIVNKFGFYMYLFEITV